MLSKGFTVVIVLVFIAAFIGMALLLLGKLPAVIFSAASIGGFLLWLATTLQDPYRYPKNYRPLFTNNYIFYYSCL